ncbi:Uncharacterized protein APZ42_004642, partial [Daphnia magna]
FALSLDPDSRTILLFWYYGCPLRHDRSPCSPIIHPGSSKPV